MNVLQVSANIQLKQKLSLLGEGLLNAKKYTRYWVLSQS